MTVDRDATFRRIKGGGLVTEVFGEAKPSTLKGDMAIGHVRYTTAGGGGIETQPFLSATTRAISRWRTTAISSIRRCCVFTSRTRGACFQSTSDSEILAHLIKKETAITTVRASIRSSTR